MLTVELVTPQRKLFSTQADELTLTGAQGQIGILPGHIALVTSLKPGPLVIRKGQSRETYAVAGGMAQIDNDKVLVLAEAAEATGEIDAERAERARQLAEKAMLEQSAYDETFAETEAAFARALNRVTVAKG